MNPYDFVPFPNTINRVIIANANKHGKFNPSLLSGYMECELETKTKMCIKGPNNDSFWKEDQPPVIPGTSIRGMIRTVCDVIGGGCGNKIEKNYGEVNGCYFPNPDIEACSKRIKTELIKYSNKDQKSERIKQEFEVCPICSLFGFIADEVVFASRISIHDTEPSKNQKISKILPTIDIKQLMSPHPHRRSFYFRPGTYTTQGGEYLGRKFYLHADPKNVLAHKGAIPITVVNEGAKFHFRIDFENLTGSELNMLMFALALEEKWCHKLGYGKPFGLGSVKISILSLHERNHEYFKDFYQPEFIDKTNGDIQNLINEFAEQLKSKSFYDKLKSVMEYSSNSPNWLTYPSYWLSDNPDGTIECYNKSEEAKKSEALMKKDAEEQIKKMTESDKKKEKKPKLEITVTHSEEKLEIIKVDDVKNKAFVMVDGKECHFENKLYPLLKKGETIKARVERSSTGEIKVVCKNRIK